MNVLLYSATRNGKNDGLKNVIKSLVPDERLEIYRTVETLSSRLRQPRLDPFIAVIQASSESELNSMVDFGELFNDCRLFLILPDRKADTIVKGHRLRPRFLTYADNDFIRGTAVLKKMISRKNGTA